jgi:squalene-hopene/tetraprenyl-beta-curcumene cyclase
MGEKAIKEKAITKVWSCLVVCMFLMSAIPVSIFASEPIPTKIHLQDATFEWHTNQSLIAELVVENNQSLSGKEVIFYVNTTVGWHELGNSMTNESGIAKYDIFVTMQNGTYSFKADFKGDATYTSSSDTAEITVVENIPPLIIAGAIFLAKTIVWATALYLTEEYILKPIVFTPMAKAIKDCDICPYKEYYDEPDELVLIFDTALIAANVASMLKTGSKAIAQHGLMKAAKGYAVGGHKRWMLHHGKKAWADGTEALIGQAVNIIARQIKDAEGVDITEAQKAEIRSTISPLIHKSNDFALYVFHSKIPQYAGVCKVDPIKGYGDSIEVPENTAIMRIYLGWEFDVCPYRLDFYILKDPFGNTVTPSFKYLDTPEGTAVELKVDNPLSGNWNLWLDGSIVPNWTMGILYSFDSYIEILPEHQAVNPGKTVVYKIMVSNFKEIRSTIDLSVSNVPAGWNTELSQAKITLAPYTSNIVNFSVAPPITARYGINKVITVTAEFEDDSTFYSNDCTVHISPTEEIEDGIAWLHEHQKSDGSWNNNVGMTSLATLAYLNAGYDETEEDVREGIDYILGYGHVHSDGSIYSDYGHRLYETSIAMLPLIATYNNSYNDIIADARDWLVKAQWDEDCLFGSVNKDNWYYGGFGYGRNIRPDLSNTQFALMALDAADLPKNDPLWSKAQVFLKRTQARDESNDQAWANGRNSGGFIYTPDGGTAGGGSIDGYGSMTGAGIWGLMLCGADQNDGRLKDALKWVKNNYYWDRNPGMSAPESGKYYYYLCMSKALAMAVGVDGKIDDQYWYDDMARNLVSLQKSEGYWVNSNSWAWENIPDLATSYSLLSLETRIIPSEISRLSYLTFILCSNADLHVYDPLGRHVGKNYATGGIDLEIPGATFDKNGIQRIHIPNLDAGDYKIKLVGTSSGGYDLKIAGGLGEKTLKEESYSSTISKGEVHDASVNVAMLTGLTFHVTPPTKPQKCKVQITSHSSLQDRPSIIYANGHYYVAYQSWETSYSGLEHGWDIFIEMFASDWTPIARAQVTSNCYSQTINCMWLMFQMNKELLQMITM